VTTKPNVDDMAIHFSAGTSGGRVGVAEVVWPTAFERRRQKARIITRTRIRLNENKISCAGRGRASLRGGVF
jgi:hypothetical protein